MSTAIHGRWKHENPRRIPSSLGTDRSAVDPCRCGARGRPGGQDPRGSAGHCPEEGTGTARGAFVGRHAQRREAGRDHLGRAGCPAAGLARAQPARRVVVRPHAAPFLHSRPGQHGLRPERLAAGLAGLRRRGARESHPEGLPDLRHAAHRGAARPAGHAVRPQHARRHREVRIAQADLGAGGLRPVQLRHLQHHAVRGRLQRAGGGQHAGRARLVPVPVPQRLGRQHVHRRERRPGRLHRLRRPFPAAVHAHRRIQGLGQHPHARSGRHRAPVPRQRHPARHERSGRRVQARQDRPGRRQRADRQGIRRRPDPGLRLRGSHDHLDQRPGDRRHLQPRRHRRRHRRERALLLGIGRRPAGADAGHRGAPRRQQLRRQDELPGRPVLLRRESGHRHLQLRHRHHRRDRRTAVRLRPPDPGHAGMGAVRHRRLHADRRLQGHRRPALLERDEGLHGRAHRGSVPGPGV